MNIEKYNHIFRNATGDVNLQETEGLDVIQKDCGSKYCAYCKECNVDKGFECNFPNKIRPCEQMFGVDMYRTARNKGLPISVLQSQKEIPNRYGLVFVE